MACLSSLNDPVSSSDEELEVVDAPLKIDWFGKHAFPKMHFY
jgi:hypothetical protein